MMSNIKTIGVLTSGGDAPGMNAAIRAIVRTAIAEGKNVKGVRWGYEGLMKGDIVDLDVDSVFGINQKGGTILYTSRSEEFKTEEGMKRAVNTIKENGMDALIVIGGDGSFRGARALSQKEVPVIGIPGTIDMDIPCTDYTIGFDTAANTAMEAIDKISDSSTSHGRCSVIEVMGRKAGYIALWAGMASGADDIIIPEKWNGDYNALMEHILERRAQGKNNHIIVVAEGVEDSPSLAEKIKKCTGIESRVSVLGYIQRGGNPTATDRMYASFMGAYAVEILCNGKKNRIVAMNNGKFVDYDIDKALGMSKKINSFQYELSLKLSK
ncbi:MAG: 6-phosphofructokinase [Eubacterium sp.]